ncbi:MAG: hypothetical protein EPO40_35125 [Myxococcaceae bacterium]|nr:MAG: hypothetical protein EPO40_35125 [Myxococcaceae bacterium]
MTRRFLCALLVMAFGCAEASSNEPPPEEDAAIKEPDAEVVEDTGSKEDLGKVPTEDLPPVTEDLGTPAVDAGRCRANIDCTGTPTPVCDSASGRCVQCMLGDTAHPCARGSYCTSANTCARGCASDLDCVGLADGGPPLSCNVAHECTAPACRLDDDCPLGNVCRSGRCAVGCTLSHGCASGLTCCSGMCSDLQRDPTHCGACTTACSTTNATAACVSGACRLTCASGFGDCNARVTDGCEASVTSSLTHCGGCGMACTFTHGMGVCATSACVVTSCEPGFQDCDGNGANGCESNPNSDTMNCGRCGNVCAGGMTCTAGVCACPAGQMVCGMTCTNTQSDRLNCGACNLACPSGQVCVAGMCSSMPLYHGWTSPVAGCSTTSYNTTAPTALGGTYPYNTGDSAACRAWKVAATVCTTQPVSYSGNENWSCSSSGGFTDPTFGTYCARTGQYSCSSCPGACNAGPCRGNSNTLRNCVGSETTQP